MSSLTPFDFFQVYQAIYLHFSKDSEYDFYKYNGKVKSSLEKFEARPDKYSYHKFTRKFTDLGDFIYFVAWCFMTKDKVSSKTIMRYQREFNEKWLKWHKDRLVNYGKDLIIISKDDTEGKSIYDKYLAEETHLGTLLIMDFLTGVFDSWNEKKKGTYPWDDFYYRVNKFIPFYERYEPINLSLYSKVSLDTLTKLDIPVILPK